MAYLLSGVTQSLVGRAVRRGLLGGHPVWRLALVVVGLTRLLHFLGKGRPAAVREDLRPGETVVVRHLPRPTDAPFDEGSTGKAV
ncbi:MAG: hypothetical protein CL466_10280 [Acidimicrobiaceae bacterium]|nr:hypothetical protein [Acidimicrobiaceae bacterium]|tara:strand:- start:569 stop:823 length:255 start_codon:yes stop_codon:yes gene_type:complete